VRVRGVLALVTYVSPDQVNFQIPPRLPAGEASITITAADGSVSQGGTRLTPVSPALFAADFQNKVPVGTALRFRNGVQVASQALWQPDRWDHRQTVSFAPIDPGLVNDQTQLVLHATGLLSPHLGQFVKIGSATVSPDGQRIATAQNAIRETGIYLVSNARPTTTVTGRVVTRGDNLPVPQAQVRIRGQLAQTDGNGSFLLRTVHPGENGRLLVEALQLRGDRTIVRTEQQAASRVAGEILPLPDPLVFQPPNRTPSLEVPSFFVTVPGFRLTFRAVATDADLNQTLTITATSPRAGLPAGATLTQTGNIAQFTWTPTGSQMGGTQVALTVIDNGTPVKSATFNVVVWVRPMFPVAPVPTLMEFLTATVNAAGVSSTIAGKPVNRYFEEMGGGLKLEMVMVPGGTYTMGSPESEVGRSPAEGPQRQVLISEIALGKYEVTQAQWQAVMGTNPSHIKGDHLPVDGVNWDDTQEFCRRLNAGLGLSESEGYRLPSEAEWEYAARAGTSTPFAFGETINTQVVNFDGSEPYGHAPPGQRRWRPIEVGGLAVANAWGFYDMHGNVAEWCLDPLYSFNFGGLAGGSAETSSPPRSLRYFTRGGSAYSPAADCRSAARSWSLRTIGDLDVGFRLARTLPKPPTY
jgi:formylglycine-generating enzyme required for sulfatase activity